MAKIVSFPTSTPQSDPNKKPRRVSTNQEPSWVPYVGESFLYALGDFLLGELSMGPLKLNGNGSMGKYVLEQAAMLLTPYLPELPAGDALQDEADVPYLQSCRFMLAEFGLLEVLPRSIQAGEHLEACRAYPWSLWSLFYQRLKANPDLPNQAMPQLAALLVPYWDRSLSYILYMTQYGPVTDLKLLELLLPSLQFNVQNQGVLGAEMFAGRREQVVGRCWWEYLVLGHFVPLGLVQIKDDHVLSPTQLLKALA